MEKYIGIAWLVATLISWLSLVVASWFWADDFENPGMLVLTLLWFALSLILFLIGVRFRKSS